MPVRSGSQGRDPIRPGWLRLIVTDTGPGSRRPTLPHLFEPFYTTKSSGTGLGLALSYGIVQNHLGTIDVQSRPRPGGDVRPQLPGAATASPVPRSASRRGRVLSRARRPLLRVVRSARYRELRGGAGLGGRLRALERRQEEDRIPASSVRSTIRVPRRRSFSMCTLSPRTYARKRRIPLLYGVAKQLVQQDRSETPALPWVLDDNRDLGFAGWIVVDVHAGTPIARHRGRGRRSPSGGRSPRSPGCVPVRR